MLEPLDIGASSYRLHRWPLRRTDLLRAWDTADRYLHEEGGQAAPGRLLVVNDRFGALAVPLHAHAPTLWSDSHLTRLALDHNLAANGLDPGAVVFVPADTEPEGVFDTVLARVPKSLAFWEDTLLRLRSHLAPGARLLAGGMIKHTPRRAFELMEEIIGPTRTTQGWKKARLALAEVDPDRDLPSRLPDERYELEGYGITLSNGPNLFSRNNLDIGTRALLPHLPADLGPARCADLGCGNGALALALARRNPEAEILGVDASYQAVASARRNAAAAGLAPPRVEIEVADGLTTAASESLDLVVCNPPFHQDRIVGDQLAWGMFTHAHRCLKDGGRLLVVANRHLGHERRLERIFGNCTPLDATPRFVVLEAARRFPAVT
jgi:16S rRNA (guanine1207-N2)-methyltransferase